MDSVFFKRKYGFDDTASNGVASVVYTISAVLCPIFGFAIDKTGRNIIWVFGATICTLLAHLMLAFTFWNPWLPMSIMGIGYSILACALWPMVAIVIPGHQLGTAYGIMQSVQNLGLAVVPLLAGLIIDLKGYIVLEVFYLGSLCRKLCVPFHYTGLTHNYSLQSPSCLL